MISITFNATTRLAEQTYLRFTHADFFNVDTTLEDKRDAIWKGMGIWGCGCCLLIMHMGHDLCLKDQ